MKRLDFSTIKNIDDLRSRQVKLERRAHRQGNALNRHLIEFWKPWQSIAGAISNVWSITSSFRSNLFWWLAKPLVGKVLKIFSKK